jgi:4'-phosphopantetheinyl transferase
MNNFLESEIQIWVIDLDRALSDLARLESTLSVDEMARSARYRYLPVRQHFILARGALRMICSQYLDSDPRTIVFGYGEHGKPFVSQPNTAIQFNMTHSGGLALAAFTNNIEVGIDIELIRPIAEMEILVANHFSPLERAQFKRLPDDLKLTVFFNSWTRKEAFIKGRGCGFSLPFNQFSVGMLPDRPIQLLRDSFDAAETEAWQLLDLALSDHEEYRAALAYHSPKNCRLIYQVFCPSEIKMGSN